jgi:hypothetical protein
MLQIKTPELHVACQLSLQKTLCIVVFLLTLNSALKYAYLAHSFPEFRFAHNEARK